MAPATALLLLRALPLIWACAAPGPAPAQTAPAPVEWVSFGTAEGLPDDGVLSLCVRAGVVWVGTEAGLARLEGARWSAWKAADGLSCPVVSAIAVDPRTEDVWLGTLGGGLFRFSGGRFDRFDQFNSGISGNVVFAVLAEEGRIWAATNGGLSAYHPVGDLWELHCERHADLPETVITSLALWQGRLQGGAWLEGLRGFDLARDPAAEEALVAVEIAQPQPPFAQELSRISAAGGALWAATNSALHRRLGQEAWRAFGIADEGMAPGPPYCLAARGAGEVWLGTRRGLFRLIPDAAPAWTAFRGGAGGVLPDDHVRCIAFDGADVWAGTAAGLVLCATADRARARGAPTAAPAPAADTRERAELAITLFGAVGLTIALPRLDPQGPQLMPSPYVTAAREAVARANATRREKGLLELEGLSKSLANYGWSLPEDDFTANAFRFGTLGAVGDLTPDRRVTSFVAWLLGVPLVSASTQPATPDEAGNHWIFRCPINQRPDHVRVLDHLFDALGCKRPALLRSGGPLEALHLDWWAAHARARGFPPLAELALDADEPELEAAMQELGELEVDAVLTWCDVVLSAKIARALSRSNLPVVLVGSDQLVSGQFLEIARERPETLLAPWPCTHRRDLAGMVNLVLAAGPSASPASLLTYDATRHLCDAVHAAGPDRGAVRAALQQTRHSATAVLEGRRWRKLGL